MAIDVIYVVGTLSGPPIRAFLTESEALDYAEKMDTFQPGSEPLEVDAVPVGAFDGLVYYQLTLHIQALSRGGGFDFDIKVLSEEDSREMGDHFYIPKDESPSDSLYWVCILAAESPSLAHVQAIQRFRELSSSGTPLPLINHYPDMGVLGMGGNYFSIVRPILGKGVNFQC